MTGLFKNILPLQKVTLDMKLNATELRRKEMEPPILLIKEISFFSTRSSFNLTFYYSCLLLFHFNSLFSFFEHIFPLPYMFVFKFFLLRAIDV